MTTQREPDTSAEGRLLEALSKIDDLIAKRGDANEREVWLNEIALIVFNAIAERGDALAECKGENTKLREVALAYEAWEAAVILCDAAWTPETGFYVPQEHYDRLIEIQGMRNAALGRFAALAPASGEKAT